MDAINWTSFLFLLFGSLACLFALAVVFAASVVRMAFYLIMCLGATSGLFFLAGADFVGAMQLMIYVGGTLVLLIFGVMLTAQSPFIKIHTSGGDWILAGVLGGSLLAVLIPAAVALGVFMAPADGGESLAANDGVEVAQPTATRIGQGLVGARVDQLEQSDEVLARGMSGYLLPFEIIAIHLLVVLVGAAYLARSKKRAAASRVEDSEQ